MEEPAFLIAMDGVVGRVEIEDDALGRRRVGLEKEADEQPFHCALVHAQLAIAVFVCFWRALKAVQRGLPASTAQSERRASALPETRPSTGSWRSSS